MANKTATLTAIRLGLRMLGYLLASSSGIRWEKPTETHLAQSMAIPTARPRENPKENSTETPKEIRLVQEMGMLTARPRETPMEMHLGLLTANRLGKLMVNLTATHSAQPTVPLTVTCLVLPTSGY